MTTIKREYAALESLQYYELMDEVLKAEPSPMLNFGDEAVQGVMKNYTLNSASTHSEARCGLLFWQHTQAARCPASSSKSRLRSKTLEARLDAVAFRSAPRSPYSRAILSPSAMPSSSPWSMCGQPRHVPGAREVRTGRLGRRPVDDGVAAQPPGARGPRGGTYARPRARTQRARHNAALHYDFITASSPGRHNPDRRHHYAADPQRVGTTAGHAVFRAYCPRHKGHAVGHTAGHAVLRA
ncbi:hypothetical protein B0T24DRAFT_598216 [Lasiosphaeria ovina]|uniref:Uncharacterized protein n=1 Tax=Lasiosphaeria ovina TaxID=92902 RepID=A0AAE0MZQ3_9PEZI|nr:hypothetical protein B0T24DRAFT_598216 [Lasiosphaeria ovina]